MPVCVCVSTRYLMRFGAWPNVYGRHFASPSLCPVVQMSFSRRTWSFDAYKRQETHLVTAANVRHAGIRSLAQTQTQINMCHRPWPHVNMRQCSTSAAANKNDARRPKSRVLFVDPGTTLLCVKHTLIHVISRGFERII